jgi:plasmid stability protein
MLPACYGHASVSAIQVKNVPEELHAELRRRAAAEGTTVGELVLRAIRRELRAESVREWLERAAARPRPPGLTREVVREILDEVRSERRYEG